MPSALTNVVSLHISSPIPLHQALQNSALGLPVLWLLRPIPARSGGQRLSDDPFPVAILAPILPKLACTRSQDPTRMLGDSGGRVLPIVPRILLGSTSDTNLSRLINVFASIGEQSHSGRSHAARVTGFLHCCSSATVSCQSRVLDEPNNQSDEPRTPCIGNQESHAEHRTPMHNPVINANTNTSPPGSDLSAWNVAWTTHQDYWIQESVSFE